MVLNYSYFKFTLTLFYSIDKVPKVTSPVLVIHGTDDEVINFSHGLAIYERCPRAVEPLWVEVMNIVITSIYIWFQNLEHPNTSFVSCTYSSHSIKSTFGTIATGIGNTQSVAYFHVFHWFSLIGATRYERGIFTYPFKLTESIVMPSVSVSSCVHFKLSIREMEY